MPIIKLKRGNKEQLPLLNSGEAAFTLNSKELFIGDGSANYNMTPVRKNLLCNANFQIPLGLSESDTDGITIPAGTGQYIYGNFYISNQPAAAGSFKVAMPAGGSGCLRFIGSQCQPALEYRLMLSVTTTGGISSGYYSPLENQLLTISFDYNNHTSSAISFQAGHPGYLVSSTLPPGAGRASVMFVYSRSILAGNSYPSMNFVLFKPQASLTGQLDIGNCKVEQGTTATAFQANSIYEDFAALNEAYRMESHFIRAASITANTLTFFLPQSMPYPYSTSAKLTLARANIYNLLGINQTGFTSTVMLDANSSCFKITSNKTLHTLTDAAANIQLIVEYRP